MLIREVIASHLGSGTVHTRGDEVPGQHTDGLRRHAADGPADPQPNDLVLVSVSRDHRLSDLVGTDLLGADLPYGTTVLLLIRTEPAQLPVGRVVRALLSAGLKIIEAVVVSDADGPSVAVVARRSRDVLLPQPPVARELEPSIAVLAEPSDDALARVLIESVLENLSQRARERVLLGEIVQAEHEQQVAELRSAGLIEQLGEIPEELAQVSADRDALEAERDQLIAELKAVKRRLQVVESSTSYRLASTLARGSGRVRRMVPRSGK